MVKLLLLFLLLPREAPAVWQDQLFDRPAPGYFAKALPALFDWTREKFPGYSGVPDDGKRFLALCQNAVESWYVDGTRLSRFSVRLAYRDGVKVSIRCLPSRWTPALLVLRRKLAPGAFPQALGFEFEFGSPSYRLILKDQELWIDSGKIRERRTVSAFQHGPPPAEAGFPFAGIVTDWSEIQGREKAYRLELQAYADGLAPPALRERVEDLRREFGLLADSIIWVPGKGAEVCFP